MTPTARADLATLEPSSLLPPWLQGRMGVLTPTAAQLARIDRLALAWGARYATPALPTPTGATYYLDAAAGNDANPGTEALPIRTLAKLKTMAANGVRFYGRGSSNDTFVGLVTASNVQLVAWPGYTWTFAYPSGPPNDYPLVWLTPGLQSWWFKDINMSGGSLHSVLTQAGSHGHRFINCQFALKLQIIGCTDIRFYDCLGPDNVGTYAYPGTGDGLFIQNGSHRTWLVRWTVRNCGHAAITISYQSAGEATCDDCEFFDIGGSNTWSAGLIVNGKAVRTIVRGLDIRDCGTHPSSGALSREMLQVMGTDGLFEEIIGVGAELVAVSFQSYTFAGFLQLCNRNTLRNATLYGNRGMALQLLERLASPDFRDNVFENVIAYNNGLGPHDEPHGWYTGTTYYPFWIDTYNATTPAGGFPTTTDMLGNVLRNCRLHQPGAPGGQSWVLVSRPAGAGGTFARTKAEAESGWAGWANNRDTGDPLLVNPPADVSLAAGSPDVDAGIPVAGDVSGTHYSGARRDLGARYDW